MTRQELEARAKRLADEAWAEFVQSLRDYPTYGAWLEGYELPKHGWRTANPPQREMA